MGKRVKEKAARKKKNKQQKRIVNSSNNLDIKKETINSILEFVPSLSLNGTYDLKSFSYTIYSR